MNESLRDVIAQELLEQQFNRKHINPKVKEFILKEGKENVQQAVDLVKQWLETDHWESKNKRLELLKPLDLEELVVKVLVNVLPLNKPVPFTSVSAQVSNKLGWSDKPSAIATAAELLAVIAQTGLYSIDRNANVLSNVQLPEQLQYFIERSAYLPPMVCRPLELKDNYDSGYLTHKESVILNDNHHNGDVCLDVLNLMNSVALKLNLELLDSVEEQPNTEPETQDQLDQWLTFKKHSREMYRRMVERGNEFFLTHKVDKRGRIYSCGYHINTQGTPYKKASIVLAQEEVIEVPQEFKEV